MLKGLDVALSAELLNVLMAMGHGDEIVICDANYPSTSMAKYTTHGKIINMAGCELPRAVEAILSVMPLDTFVDVPIFRMEVVGEAEKIMPIHTTIQAVIDKAEGKAIKIGSLERFEFYEASKKAFAIVRTSDLSPYGCFILKMGVI
ncbi:MULTISPECIES: RbsD/FucU family protein [unclassified Bartonella]|uniref:RbsD/FucU family protein n=1 Tax=unclassified Bartonella TaxID=2645622 RepID=UPI0021C85693|nr:MULTISPECIES: RbsD/FucU domain-containing protein [unclassified Bartonella]UXN03528.1 fucose-binding protein [Bartonella sp. HY406]UXN06495.1 fucose-binding protein [Bartonella sp. HY761]